MCSLGQVLPSPEDGDEAEVAEGKRRGQILRVRQKSSEGVSAGKRVVSEQVRPPRGPEEAVTDPLAHGPWGAPRELPHQSHISGAWSAA